MCLEGPDEGIVEEPSLNLWSGTVRLLHGQMGPWLGQDFPDMAVKLWVFSFHHYSRLSFPSYLFHGGNTVIPVLGLTYNVSYVRVKYICSYTPIYIHMYTAHARM